MSSCEKAWVKGLFCCKRYNLLALCFLNYVLGFIFQSFSCLFYRILCRLAQCHNSCSCNAPEHHSKQHITVHINLLAKVFCAKSQMCCVVIFGRGIFRCFLQKYFFLYSFCLLVFKICCKIYCIK